MGRGGVKVGDGGGTEEEEEGGEDRGQTPDRFRRLTIDAWA
jgi:hypothetical protein